MNDLRVSFEVFPPKTPAGVAALAANTVRLVGVNPRYISVTYGAGGNSRDKSFAAIEAVRSEAGTVPVAGHLTCVGQSIAEIEAILDRYDELGVDHIVALRGDPPEGIDAAYYAHPDGYQSTADLVRAIAQRKRFEIAVSAYPEIHPQSPTGGHDLDLLRAKIDAGATLAMTQMFFDNDQFLRYRDAVAAAGITVPVVPGIFPVHSFPSVANFAARCRASVPTDLAEAFVGLDDDVAATHALGAELAALQIARLHQEGVAHVHLYTLNKADLVLRVLDHLAITAVDSAAATK